MEEDTEQTGQGGMMDDLMGRGREAAGQAMSDPEMRDRIAGQAEERFGNVPGMGQATQAFRSGGSGSMSDTGGDAAAEYDTGGDTSAIDNSGMEDTESSQY